MEKYSVLMSLYQKENPEYLKQAIDSMINQTVKPDEIVMVYDGELTSELYKVMDVYLKKYPDLFHIIKHEVNLGLGISLNKGVIECKNELIARMDTDDISVKNRCEEQLHQFEINKDLSIVGGQISEFIGNPKDIVSYRIVPKNDEQIKDYLKTRCPFNHMTVMFKKQDVQKSGNYQDWCWNEDYFLWIRMLEKGCVFKNLDTVLVHARISKEMFRRRGGIKYFKSEFRLQHYMFKQRIIGKRLFVLNVAKRFFVEILVPNRLREIIYQKVIRKVNKTYIKSEEKE